MEAKCFSSRTASRSADAATPPGYGSTRSHTISNCPTKPTFSAPAKAASGSFRLTGWTALSFATTLRSRRQGALLSTGHQAAGSSSSTSTESTWAIIGLERRSTSRDRSSRPTISIRSTHPTRVRKISSPTGPTALLSARGALLSRSSTPIATTTCRELSLPFSRRLPPPLIQ